MPLKLPQILGHRGCAAYAPENTLEGLHTAADMGVEWVEFDVKLTKDQVPILFHDETLERTTNGSGNVRDFTLEEIKELDAGSWFSDGFFGVTVPTLEEAVDVLIERGLGLNLEIKPCPGREVETAEVALDVLSGIWDDHERLLLASFSHLSLETTMSMVPGWHRDMYIPAEIPENLDELIEIFDPSVFAINGMDCDEEYVRTLCEYNKPIMAYTINEAERARQLQSWGVNGICTDAPDVILDGILSVH